MSTRTVKPVTPPLFGDFGKKAKDLFKKKYDYENQLVLKDGTNSTPAKIETRVVAPNDAPLRGVFKSELKFQQFGLFNGVFESEFHTVANKESKTGYKFTNLTKGAGVKATLVGVKPEVRGETPDFPEGWLAVEATYSQDYVAGQVVLRTNGQKNLVDANVALGYDNIFVGAKVTVDAASKSAPNNYDFGAEYKGGNFIATAVTEKQRANLKLGYYTQVRSGQIVGAEATFGLIKPTRTLTFGADYTVDPDTLARGFVRVDSSKDASTLGLAIDHRLSDSNTLIGVATEYNITQSNVSAGKFGVTFTIGDLE